MSGSDDNTLAAFSAEAIAAAGVHDPGRGETKDESERSPADFDRVLEGCAWLRQCATEQASVSEPEWYAGLSIVGRCADGRDRAHAFSSGHPGYTVETCDKKLEQALDRSGPRTCRYIRDTFGHSGCADCRHGQAYRWSASPIQLGRDSIRLNPGDDFADEVTAHEMGTPRALTDLGNAELMVDLHGKSIRHVHPWKSWIVWDGSKWARDTNGEIMRKSAKTVRFLYQLSARAVDKDMRKAINEHIIKSEKRERIGAIEALARNMVPAELKLLDAHPWLLNVRNGTIDLRTGELHKHNREQFHTKIVDVDYDPRAQSDSWFRTVLDASNNRPDLVEFMQRAFGYSLTGITTEEKLFLAYGKAGTGKSTIMGAIKDLLGDYAAMTDGSTFIKKSGDEGIRNDIAGLVGKRFVITNEVDRGKQLAESLVKHITGGDAVTARFLHQEFFEYTPQLKLWLVCNDRPLVRAGDTGMWRRILVIPFVHAPTTVDYGLKSALREPAMKSAILSWLVAGCLRWQRDGLTPPASVRAATTLYQDEMDPLGAWFKEFCESGEDKQSTVAAVRGSYEDYARGSSEEPINIRFFNRLLEERGFVRKGARVAGGYTKVWEGFALR